MQQSADTDCPICFEGLKGKALFTTACGHTFHFDCLKAAVKHMTQDCPLCRGSIQQLTNVITPVPAPQPAAVAPPMQLPMQQQRVQRRGPNFVGPSGYNFSPSQPSLSPAQLAWCQAPADRVRPKPSAADKSASTAVNVTSLHATSSVQFKALPASFSRDVLGMISLQAPDAPVDSDAARPPLDLVAVVDRSGSMSGTKIALVHTTLKYLITQLNENDRFCIIAFDHASYTICELRSMNDTNRNILSEMIESHRDLQAAGGTDISLGLRRAFEVLHSRKEMNDVTSVLLLSDGQGGTPTPQELKESCPAGCAIHSFGFGSDHDAKVLSMIAESTQGTFQYLEQLEQIGEAFATCLGGLLSVVAQAIQIHIELSSPYMIKRIHTTFRHKFEGSYGQITLDNLFASEKRDLLFSFSAPSVSPSDSPVGRASITWTSTETKSTTTTPHFPILLARCAEDAVDEGVNLSLDLQHNRVMAADAMQTSVKLAENGDLAGAKEALARAKKHILTSPTASDPASVALINDLDECATHFESQSTFSGGGYAYVQQQQMSHNQQRAVRSNKSSASAYTTPIQHQQQMLNAAHMNHK